MTWSGSVLTNGQLNTGRQDYGVSKLEFLHMPLRDVAWIKRYLSIPTDEVGVNGSRRDRHYLQIGDRVALNSGGREGLVVNLDGRGNVTVARHYPDGRIEESENPEPCWTLLGPGKYDHR